MAREMKDSGIEWIGKIPKDWYVSKLKYIGEYINGYAFKPEQWGDTGKRIIRIQDLTGSNDKPNYFEGVIDGKYNVCNGDILVSWAATLAAFIWNKGDGVLNQHIFKAKNNPDKVEYDYFFWLIKVAMEYMNNENKHGIMMQHVTLDVFGIFKVALPLLEEQRRISCYLNDKCVQIDSIIDQTRSSIEEYKKLKQAVITQAVTKGIRPDRQMKDSGIEWIGRVPNEWSITSIGRLCFVTKLAGFEYTKEMDGNITEEGQVPIVRAQNIKMGVFIPNTKEYISLEISEKLKRCALDKKCLLITFIGAGIGETAIFDYYSRAHLAPNVAKIEITEEMKRFLCEEYLLYFMMSSSGQEEVNKIKKATAQPSLSMQTIRSIKIPVPSSLNEQIMIVRYLNEECKRLDYLISHKEQIITELVSYKKCLIYEYVTGKKEVPA